jgi:hypothetical protein
MGKVMGVFPVWVGVAQHTIARLYMWRLGALTFMAVSTGLWRWLVVKRRYSIPPFCFIIGVAAAAVFAVTVDDVIDRCRPVWLVAVSAAIFYARVIEGRIFFLFAGFRLFETKLVTGK